MSKKQLETWPTTAQEKNRDVKNYLGCKRRPQSELHSEFDEEIESWFDFPVDQENWKPLGKTRKSIKVQSED
jgi:hypothetical protein